MCSITQTKVVKVGTECPGSAEAAFVCPCPLRVGWLCSGSPISRCVTFSRVRFRCAKVTVNPGFTSPLIAEPATNREPAQNQAITKNRDSTAKLPKGLSVSGNVARSISRDCSVKQMHMLKEYNPAHSI